MPHSSPGLGFPPHGAAEDRARPSAPSMIQALLFLPIRVASDCITVFLSRRQGYALTHMPALLRWRRPLVAVGYFFTNGLAGVNTGLQLAVTAEFRSLWGLSGRINPFGKTAGAPLENG